MQDTRGFFFFGSHLLSRLMDFSKDDCLAPAPAPPEEEGHVDGEEADMEMFLCLMSSLCCLKSHPWRQECSKTSATSSTLSRVEISLKRAQANCGEKRNTL